MHVASAAVPRPRMQMASVEALLHKLPSGRRAERLRHDALGREYAENRPSYEAPMGSALAPSPPMGAQVMSVRAVSAPVAAPAPAPMEGGGSLLGMAQEGSN